MPLSVLSATIFQSRHINGFAIRRASSVAYRTGSRIALGKHRHTGTFFTEVYILDWCRPLFICFTFIFKILKSVDQCVSSTVVHQLSVYVHTHVSKDLCKYFVIILRILWYVEQEGG